MKIEAGKWYRDEDGAIGIAKAHGNSSFSVCSWMVSETGKTNSGKQRIVAEVTVTDVLPFELVAGKKYETVSPDGKPGPVVELTSCDDEPEVWRARFPVRTHVSGYGYLITADGLVLHSVKAPLVGYRIVREHVPPTPIERLEKWREEWIGSTYQMKLDGLDSIIADLKAGAKC